MLKIKIKNPTCSENQFLYLEKLIDVLFENPLSHFDLNDSFKMKDWMTYYDECYRELKRTYKDSEVFSFIKGRDYTDSLIDSDGVAYYPSSKTLTLAGNVIQVLEQSNKSEGPGIIKISKTEYINVKNPIELTDSIDVTKLYEYQNHYYLRQSYESHSEKSANELRKTFRRLSDLINANTQHPECCLWITLTYADNIKGSDGNEKLYKDFKVFIQRLRRLGYSFEYISCIEPQGRGAWHSHLILIFDKPTFIDNSVIAECWGQGFTKTKALDDSVDNLGSYLTAYLCDIPLDDLDAYSFDEACNVVEICPMVEKDGKSYLKGGRLYMYPLHMKLYRTSRGIKQPEVYKDCTDSLISEKIKGLHPLYTTSYELKLDSDSHYKNVVRYTQYNLNVKSELDKLNRDRKLKR